MMTVEELLAKKISNEIDIQIMERMMKTSNVLSKENVKKTISKMIEKQNMELERAFVGGTKEIHNVFSET